MTELQIIDEDIKTLEAEKMIIRICHDHLNGIELDDIISKYIFEMKGAIRDTRRQDNKLVNLRNFTARLDPDFDYDGQRDLEKDNADE
jgi:hypothetical protein